MLTRIFWILFAAEAVALLFFLVAAAREASRSPEGPVGAWVLFLPPIGMLIAGTLFATVRWEPVRWACFFFLAYPLVLVAAQPLVRAYQERRVERLLAGDDDFAPGPFRELAHAVRAGDAARVRTLLPVAGDLNQRHGGETILRFAVANTKSVEIVSLLLKAGADPNYATAYGDLPFAMALFGEPAMVAALLDAGANVNLTDGAGRPLWWQVLSDGTGRGMVLLELLAAHRLDTTMRDGESGPVGWAAYHKNWRAVWWLMEHGAAWREEQRYGTASMWTLEYDLPYRTNADDPMTQAAHRVHETWKQP